MEEKIKVAVMGATGAVGQVFMWMLAHHPWFEPVFVTASASRVGLKYATTVHWVMPFEMPAHIKEVVVQEFNIEAMKNAGVKIVFSALPSEVANEAEPQLRDNGFYVFSNAASMRYEQNVPILIPEANLNQMRRIEAQGYPESGFVITNANCSTTGLAMAIAPLVKYGIREIMMHSYQSVSGAGYPGLSSFDITDNCIPFIKGEEEKVEKEIKKILEVDCDVNCYTVRVPVMFGHLEAVWLDLEEDVSLEQIIEDWKHFTVVSDLPSSAAQPVEYSNAPAFPQPKYAFWGNPSGMVIYTGRLKKRGNKVGFLLLVNNVVKGAAGGSIQNAEAFVKHYGLR